MPPALSTARSLGLLNIAALPTPFRYPAAVAAGPPPPASVVTALLETATIRMRLLLLSAMYKTPPLSSSAAPAGLLNLAALPAPSEKPAAVPPALPPPASVLTAALEIATARMRLLAESATKSTVPFLSTAAPAGERNRAALPAPST